MDPGWLGAKLEAAAPTGVVADFRRFLLARPGDREVKLALEAFQMSVGQVRGLKGGGEGGWVGDSQLSARARRAARGHHTAHPPTHPQVQAHPNVPGLLRCLMIGRLSSVPGSQRMQVRGGRACVWLGRGAGPARAQLACWQAALACVCACACVGRCFRHARSPSIPLQPRPPTNPPTHPPTNPPAHPIHPTRLRALQDWLDQQRRLVYVDAQAALLHGRTRCLLPLTPSLDQAGGMSRLALRGHTGAVTKLLLTPSGTDVVSASADGTGGGARAGGGVGVGGGVGEWAWGVGRVVGGRGGSPSMSAHVRHACPHARTLTHAPLNAPPRAARVWDLEIGDCVLLLEGHAAPITDLAITLGALSHAGAGHALLVPRSRASWGELSLSAVPASPSSRAPTTPPLTPAPLTPPVIPPPDGSLVLTASEDGTARAFEMERGQCLRVLVGHSAPVQALAIDPWARFVVTASADGTGGRGGRVAGGPAAVCLRGVCGIWGDARARPSPPLAPTPVTHEHPPTLLLLLQLAFGTWPRRAPSTRCKCGPRASEVRAPGLWGRQWQPHSPARVRER